MTPKIALACVTVGRGNCIDAMETGRAGLSRELRGELALHFPLGQGPPFPSDSATLETSALQRKEVQPEPDSIAPSKGTDTQWIEVRLRGRTVKWNSTGRVCAWILPAPTRGKRSLTRSQSIQLHPREMLVLKAQPLTESRGKGDALLALDDFDHLARGLVPKQAARQLASLILGRQPEACVTLLVLATPGTFPVLPALAALGLALAGVALLTPRLQSGSAGAADAGNAVLLSGAAATVAEEGMAGDPLRRLEVIPPETRVQVSLPAVFGFASHEDGSGLESYRLFASQGTLLEFDELDRRARNTDGPLRPVLVEAAEGELVLLRGSTGRQACLARGGLRFCTSSSDGMSALGAACTSAGCTWACLAGACLLSGENREVTMPARSILPSTASSPVALSAAQASFWNDLCGGCLTP